MGSVTFQISRIFEVLEIILVNIASRLPKLKPVGKAIVRRILAGHVGTIIYCLNMKNKSGQIKSGLKLLSAMVMQGDTTPRDILAQVDLQHPAWPPLLNRRDLLVRKSFFVPDFYAGYFVGSLDQVISVHYWWSRWHLYYAFHVFIGAVWLKKRLFQDPMDVRGCLLHFMLSFLMVGEKDTIRAVLEIRGMI